MERGYLFYRDPLTSDDAVLNSILVQDYAVYELGGAVAICLFQRRTFLHFITLSIYEFTMHIGCLGTVFWDVHKAGEQMMLNLEVRQLANQGVQGRYHRAYVYV